MQTLKLIFSALTLSFIFTSCQFTDKDITRVPLEALYERLEVIEVKLDSGNARIANLQFAVSLLQNDVSVVLEKQELSQTDREILKEMLRTLTSIAQQILANTAESKAFLVTIKDFQLVIYNKLESLGEDLTDIKFELAKTWLKLLEFGEDLEDIEDILGDLDDDIQQLLVNDNLQISQTNLLIQYVQANGDKLDDMNAVLLVLREAQVQQIADQRAFIAQSQENFNILVGMLGEIKWLIHDGDEETRQVIIAAIQNTESRLTDHISNTEAWAVEIILNALRTHHEDCSVDELTALFGELIAIISSGALTPDIDINVTLENDTVVEVIQDVAVNNENNNNQEQNQNVTTAGMNNGMNMPNMD
jgi:hypothetical protein